MSGSRSRLKEIYPTVDIYSVKPEGKNHFTINKDNESNPIKRHVFYKVPFEQVEIKQLEFLHQSFVYEDIKLPYWWQDSDTLRFFNEFSDQTALIEKLKQHMVYLQMINQPDYFKQMQKKGVQFILESGFVYQYGRDKKYRPNIY